MPNDNPSPCCGSKTACCSGHVIPDRLVATVVADCGTFTFPIVVIQDDNEKTVWSGSGNFQCKNPPGSPCIDRDVSLTIELDHFSCEWDFDYSGNCDAGMANLGCPPFLLERLLECCSTEATYLVVSE